MAVMVNVMQNIWAVGGKISRPLVQDLVKHG